MGNVGIFNVFGLFVCNSVAIFIAIAIGSDCGRVMPIYCWRTTVHTICTVNAVSVRSVHSVDAVDAIHGMEGINIPIKTGGLMYSIFNRVNVTIGLNFVVVSSMVVEDSRAVFGILIRHVLLI